MHFRMVVPAAIFLLATIRILAKRFQTLAPAFFSAVFLVALQGFATPSYALSSGCTALSGYFDSASGGYHGTSSASNFNTGERVVVTWTSGNGGSNYWITSGGATVFGPSTGTGTYTVPSTTSNPIAVVVNNTGNFRIDWSCLAPLGAAPTVTALSPATGPTAGGTSVTLTGTGFTGATAVHFGATNAPGFSVNSDSSITVSSPSGSAGTVNVTVTNPGGTSTTGAANQFTYVSPVTATTAIASKAATQARAVSAFTPVTGSGGTAPLTYSISPALPAGLSVSGSSGTISGTPSVTLAPSNFTVTVTDTNGLTASAGFALAVNSAVTATQGVPSTALTANHSATAFRPVTGGGGTGGLTYSVFPTLPSGLSLDASTGFVSGVPTATSSAATYTVTITDINGATASNTFSLAVNGSPTATQAVASITLTSGHAATAFTPVTGSGGTTPLTYSISPALPGGLSFNASTGLVSGTPTSASGTATYTVTVTDTNGATASNTFGLTVNGPPTATQAIASVALTSGRAATAFTPVTGSGGTAPLTYSISPALPAGLSINASTGAVTGTPTTSLTATTFVVTVTDSNSTTASNNFILIVNSPVAASQAVASATLTANHAASTFVPVTGSGGTAPLAYGISPVLPAGLSFDTSTGAVSGTATSASSATTYTVTVTDTNGSNASQSFSLAVNGPIAASQAVASTSLTTGHAATSFTPVTGSGGTGTLSYAVSPSLPSGLSFSTATGTVSGTPTAASGATTYTVTVTDINGATASATFGLTVNSAVAATQAVASTSLTSGHAATAFTPVAGSGGTGALSYAVSPSLPAGLAFDTATGVVSGTPTSANAATTYTVTVSDANGATAAATFSLTVNGAVTATQAVASASLTSGHAVTSFTPVTGSGGTGALSYSVSPSLPAGVAFSTSSGAVSGSPTAASAATTYTVTVTDANGATATATFNLTVNGAVTATQAVASASLTRGHAAASFTPVTGGGGTGTLSYAISPSLPSGLSFSTSSGTVSGTATSASTATTYTVTVTDTNGATGSATFSLTVNGAVTATQAIASTSLTSGHAATSFTPVTGSGGTGTLSYTVSPSLPSGLSFSGSSGTVSGTATSASGATSYTVTVTDANGATASAAFSLAVNGAVTANQIVASTTLTSGHAATSFTPVSGSGGTGTLSYSVSPSLPSGLSFSTSSGAVSGTAASASGATSYTVTVTDANGATASAAFDLTVNGAVTATQAVASTMLTNGHAATSFTPVTGSGGTGTLSYAVSPSLPSGLSFSTSSGTVSGTPASASSATTYTVTISDANGATGSATFSLTVNGAVTATQAIASTSLTSGHAATSFTPVTGSGGTGTLSYNVSPSLPAGLTFNTATGTVSGTPGAGSGTASYTVTVTDTNGATASAAFSLTVNGAVTATQAIASQTLILGHAASTFAPVTGSGGTGALTYALSPTLPSGLSFNTATGAISGIPTAISGATTYTVAVTDTNGATASATFSLTVILPTLTFTPTSLPNGVAGNAYAQTITASSGMGPYSYAVSSGSLPDGLSLDTATGKLSGTPKGAGASNFTITATDVHTATGSITYALTISGPAITVVSSSATVVAGVSTTIDLTQGATGGPFTGARLVSLSPASAGTAMITLGDTAAASEMVVAEVVSAGHYKLKFTASPDFSGTAVATFTLSNVFGSSPPGTVTFVVTPRKDPSKDPDVIGLINAQTDAAKRFAETQISNFNDHLEQLHGDGCLQNQWDLTVSDNRSGSKDNSTTPQTDSSDDGLLARKGKDKPAHPQKARDDSKDRCSPFGEGSIAVWTGGFVNFGSRNISSLDQGYDYTTVGVSAGVDYRFSKSFTAGVGLGYGSDQSRIGDNGTQSDAKSYSFALYGSYHPTSDTFIDSLAGYGLLNFDSKRFAVDTDSFANGSRDGHQFFGSVTTGYEYTNDGFLISPYGRLSASRSTLDSFTESGADWANLSYGSQSIDTLTGTLGLRVAYKIGTDWGFITPRARLEYGHDFAGDSSVSLGYADLPNSKFDLKTLGTGNDYATVSVGADFKVGQDLTIGAEYGTTLGQTGTTPQQVRLSIRERF
ncbi:autotransporter domain-containing protein [Rhizobium lusitanum]|uniref:Autotransporter domain-containing protein n=1 Tax=Rhizobium lusitanum TaxID=293958 RepID=A0A6L9U034_9HYPH|nr:putative Ig domain-containing protein [Rhizobium lusitanum]NEI69225.1 autotransporter domain-containing protein [Rhizobium lusitanum]